MSEQYVAVTHNGKFHADEVFATAVLKHIYPDLTVRRSRDPKVIESGDFVYDVGGIYDHETKRYDHHQNGALKRQDGLTRSAFGLIWLHYGKEYCDGDDSVWNLIDKRLVRGIDAGDNGESRVVQDPRAPEFDISQVIELLNPIPGKPEEEADTQFSLAVGYAATLLARLVERARAELDAVNEIQAARAESTTPRYAVLDHYVAMSECVAELEGLEYVVFPDEANGMWQVYAVPEPGKPFSQKRPFPESWAGLRDQELAELTGVPDALFCHTKRFLAVAKSREGATRLLEFALAEPHDSVVSLESYRLS